MKKTHKCLFIGISVVIAVILASGMIFFYLESKSMKDKIFPNVTIDGIPVGRFTESQARLLLLEHFRTIRKKGWRFVDVKNQKTISVPIRPELVNFQTQTAVSSAFRIGRSPSVMKNIWYIILRNVRPINIPLDVTVQNKRVELAIFQILQPLIMPVKNAELIVSIPKTGDAPVINIVTEQIGRDLRMDALVQIAVQQIRALRLEQIPLRFQETLPSLTTEDIEPLIPSVNDWLTHAPFTLTYEDRTWTVPRSMLAAWLSVTTSSESIGIGLDLSRVDMDLRTKTQYLTKKAQDGELTFKDEKVDTFHAPIMGLELDVASTTSAIIQGFARGSSTIPLVMRRIYPKIVGKEAEEKGIKELLGVGKSNFFGSPINRRKNIMLGASRVHGALVAPNEEFSLIKTLGPINGVHGWLQELVIKGNKTKPEYGGGLCQIGTTSFRGALASGLPIKERSAHAYRVPYYEPAGTDATIYEPAPDFRFLNDTPGWILITSEISGDNVSFSFWGTNDRREVKQTKPRIFNIVAPPEKKIVETLELAPGKIKCTESAHAGADASFDYTVIYPKGETKKQTFRSHYRPWGAVCLKGVAVLSESASSTSIDQTGLNNPNL